jgi:hypothetical protein
MNQDHDIEEDIMQRTNSGNDLNKSAWNKNFKISEDLLKAHI